MQQAGSLLLQEASVRMCDEFEMRKEGSVGGLIMGPLEEVCAPGFWQHYKEGQDNGEACACVCTTCTYGRITSTYKW
jgi:hypothetical protein